jgi:ParB family chromosome partitioning protein
MAEALGLSNSQLSRLLSLAQMPDDVVNAFATREDLRVRHSEVLTPLLRRSEQRELVLVAANEVSAEQQLRAGRNERMIPAAAVLARLRQAAVTEIVEADRGRSILVDGEPIGRVKPLKSGGLAVELTLAAGASLEDVLVELRDAIDLARSSGASPGKEA